MTPGDRRTLAYDGPVLDLTYESIQQDLPTVIGMLANFIGIELDQDLATLVQDRADFEFMAAHKDQFADRAPWGGNFERVVNGRVGDSKQRLAAELRTRLDDAWQTQVTPLVGYADYAELRAELDRRHSG